MSNCTGPLTSRVAGPGRVGLAVRDHGGAGRPTVLLVHGYPDNQSVWDLVAPLLAGRFRVVSYDLRGAGDSDAPRGRGRYPLRTLTGDLVAVLDAVSPAQPVHLVGHDWGSIIAWEAVTEPALAHRIASFTSISGPCLDHAVAWMREQWRHPRTWPGALRQLGRSWYLVFFQVPLLPDLLMRSGLPGRLLQRAERLPARPRTADAVHGLALYRANLFRGRGRPRERRTGVPVQLVVPTLDRFVHPRLAAGTGRWAPRLRRRTIRAGHWVQCSHPGRLAAWIGEFVADVDRRADLDGP
jgi:pimeloyl-ACP methyl ester carboxylesterase